jgi:hypothetical protein
MLHILLLPPPEVVGLSAGRCETAGLFIEGK